MRRIRIYILFIISCFIISSCKNADQLIDEYRPQIEPRLKKIEQIKTKLNSISKVEPGKLKNASISLDFVAYDMSKYNKNRNVIILHEENLEDLTKTIPFSPPIVFFPNLLNETSSLIRKGVLSYGAKPLKREKIDKQYFEPFLGLEYVLVLKTVVYIEPVLINKEQFNSGYVKYNAYLFRIEDQEHLGSFEFEAMNTKEVSDVSYTSERSLQENLFWQIDQILIKKLNIYFPNANIPYNF